MTNQQCRKHSSILNLKFQSPSPGTSSHPGKQIQDLVHFRSRFNAGYEIIENNLRVFFFLFLAPAAGSSPSGSYSNPFSNPAGQR